MILATPAAVHCATQRLQLVAALVDRSDDTTAVDLSRSFGVSVPQAYKLPTRALHALLPRPQGPRPAPASLVAASLVDLAPTRREAWDRRGAILEAALSNVSIRGQRRHCVAFGEPAPSGDFLVDTIARAGRFALALIGRAKAQVRDRITVAAGDDIYFHRTAVKVSLDPVSGALLGVARWPWREAEDWALWIAQRPALHLFISDLCTGLVGAVPLVGAARGTPLAHQGDHFHESAWWTEKDFYAAVRLEELFQRLLQPLSPEGTQWSDARVDDLLAQFAREAIGRCRRNTRRGSAGTSTGIGRNGAPTGCCGTTSR